jgi:hypothetical protein
MSDLKKAIQAVSEKLDFLRKGGAGGGFICVSTYGLAGERQISPESVRMALKMYADFGLLSLSTWRHDLWREVNWREWRSEDFFFNRDDANYVRLRLA